MKRTVFALSLLAALTLAGSPAAHAAASTQPGHGLKLNSARLNGAKLNGAKFNGPGIVVQGRTMNGPGLILQGRNFNGPGIILQGRTLNGPGLVLQGRAFNGPVLQGNRFNGARMNGSGYTGFEAPLDALVSSADCSAPPPARKWPLSALSASSVDVRLAKR